MSLWSNDNFDILAKLITDLLGVRSDVEKLAKASRSFEELDSKLGALVTDRLGQETESVNLCIRQSLLKDYSLGGETRELIYQSWFRRIKSNLNL